MQEIVREVIPVSLKLNGFGEKRWVPQVVLRLNYNYRFILLRTGVVKLGTAMEIPLQLGEGGEARRQQVLLSHIGYMESCFALIQVPQMLEKS